MGCGVWGCGHAPVGGDGGDEGDRGDEEDGGDEEDRGDEGENIFQSSLPSSPCPSPTRGGWGGVKPPHQLTNSILLLS